MQLPNDVAVGADSIDVAQYAFASSGDTVSFASTTSTICSTTGTNGETVTLLETGSCTIQASQAGDEVFGPAPDVSQTMDIVSTSALPHGLSLSS